MTVGLLVVTHDHVGSSLVDTAISLLGVCPLNTEVMEIFPSSDRDASIADASQLVDKLDQGEGVLVVTDLYGSTPFNIAVSLKKDKNVAVIAGINLPMLIRIMNYYDLSLKEMADKALKGGRDGVLAC